MMNSGYQSARGYVVLDDKIGSIAAVKSEHDLIQKMGATVYRADTIDKLCDDAGIGKYLVATVQEFNKAVDEGKAAYLAVPKKTRINKIATPPFYAIPFVLASVSTMGGLLLNARGEVQTNDGKSIPGLYAAGEVAQGTLTGGTIDSKYHGPSYIGGLFSCVFFGLLSAENAVKRIGRGKRK
jgi:hypothetical protein